ncbi:hypothetical protein PFICI_13200 [Pestalotiopsis fici W106-1]|uniref:Uncharacterized protein n=1 Tax=Pestalotiopsis fici (strain W106-1 / CGMCC3.15140) TaxID=1229662 RepID=W3WPI4_PESFW|nr:uncharacterized protein PFICI_13200 [Pestalotiopsis fici W106-1]ETS74716.1 hypothetical protein PFICI_13200 [Pestalotiopsis fici W106-1]
MLANTTLILIVTNLLLGIIFAVGHHLFYASLDGEIVRSPSQQEWYLRIGTGLSFLVRALLSASIGSAYVQLIWHNLKSTTTSIKGVDAILGVLHNIWDLTVWELWRTRPIVIVVALAIWALPLTAIVTPATLIIEPASQLREDNITMPVPIPDYSYPLKYAQLQMSDNLYQAPAARILRLLFSVASTGTILALPPPFPNSTYPIEFYGPSITCEDLDRSTSPLAQSLDQSLTEDYGMASMGGVQIDYVGFVPNCDSVVNPCLGNDTANAIWSFRQMANSSFSNDQKINLRSLDHMSSDYSKIYVVVPEPTSDFPVHFKTIKCGLYNSSYFGQVNFENGQQNLNFRIEKIQGVSIQTKCSNSRENLCLSAAPYIAMFDALAKMLLGTIEVSHYGYATPYQTQIMTSVLAQSRELQYREVISRTQVPLTIANLSTAEALEQVFTNTTLSLLSDSYFL